MFKVYVDTGDLNVATNALRFDDVASAETYAEDLYGRWLLVKGYYIIDDREGTIPAHVTVGWARENAVTSGPPSYLAATLASMALSERDEHGEVKGMMF